MLCRLSADCNAVSQNAMRHSNVAADTVTELLPSPQKIETRLLHVILKIDAININRHDVSVLKIAHQNIGPKKSSQNSHKLLLWEAKGIHFENFNYKRTKWTPLAVSLDYCLTILHDAEISFC